MQQSSDIREDLNVIDPSQQDKVNRAYCTCWFTHGEGSKCSYTVPPPPDDLREGIDWYTSMLLSHHMPLLTDLRAIMPTIPYAERAESSSAPDPPLFPARPEVTGRTPMTQLNVNS